MKRLLALTALLALMPCLAGLADGLPPAFGSIGFGVSVPYGLPIDWQSSYSFVSCEYLLTENVTAFIDLGTYPASFPDLYEVGGSVLVRGWLGASVLYAGGGLSVQYRRVGSAWAMKPHLALRAGYQIWLLESLAISAQFRSLDPLPITWAFSPEMALGFNIGLGRARPEAPRFDGDFLWVLVGFAVAALIAFLPRK